MHPRKKKMIKFLMMGMPPHHVHYDNGPHVFMKRMKPWHFDELSSRVHFKENDKTITIHVAAPGLKKESLEIKAKANMIRIVGEYQEEFEEFGPEFLIQLEVPFDIDPNSGKAKYRDGMIVLNFNRTNPPTKVDVE